MPRQILRAALGLWLALAGALPQAFAQDVGLTLPEGRTVAAQLIEAQRPSEALLIVNGILAGKPEDAPALILKSRALRDLGQTDAAIEAAQKAWRLASSDEDRFFAALVTAQARASGGQQGLGQFWLRRAAQVAPNEGLKSLAKRDFQHLRHLTPWRIYLDLRTERDDNINNAPKAEQFADTGLDPVRLEGVRGRATARFSYGIAVSQRSRAHVDLIAGITRVHQVGEDWDNAQRDARDYGEERLGFGLRKDWVSSDGKALTEIGFSADRFWFGGELGVDAPSLWLTHRRALSQGLSVEATLRRSSVTRHYATGGNSVTHGVSLGMQKTQENFRLGFSLDRSETQARSEFLANDEWRSSVFLAARKPHFGMLPRLSLTYTDTNFVGGTTLTSSEGPRSDQSWNLAVDVTLPKLDYFGFAPTIGVSFNDRASNYRLYNSRSTDLRLGLKSVF